MCSYVACVEKEKLSQEQSNRFHPLGGGGICLEAEMSHQQSQGQHSNGTHLSGGGECNSQQINMESGHDLNNSTTNNNNQLGICSTCHINWRMQSFTHGCIECGGFALIRSCPICNGHCGATWGRIIDMSNEMKSPYWNGDCRLSKEEQEAHMIRNWVSDDMDTLVEALSDLGTR